MKMERMLVALVALTVAVSLADAIAQGRQNVPPPDPTKPHKLEITTGTRARYKVREQLAGISIEFRARRTVVSGT